MNLLKGLHETALRGQITALDLQSYFKASVFYGTALTNIAEVAEPNPSHIGHLDTVAYLDAARESDMFAIRDSPAKVAEHAKKAHDMFKPPEKPGR